MRTKTALRGVAVICGAVVAGLLATGGTWAVWNSAVQVDAGTVQAADFTVTLAGVTSRPMTLSDGTQATVSMNQSQTALHPGTSMYADVTITNGTNASGPFDVQAELGTPSVTGVPSSLTPWLSTAVSPAPSSGNCSRADYTQDAMTTIGKGGSAKFCLQVTLDAKAPESAAGQTGTLEVPVKARQTR